MTMEHVAATLRAARLCARRLIAIGGIRLAARSPDFPRAARQNSTHGSITAPSRRKTSRVVTGASVGVRGATAAGGHGRQSERYRQVCQCSEKPFSINECLCDSLPIYLIDFAAEYQFMPKYHWLPF